jgi:hypothetical protein
LEAGDLTHPTTGLMKPGEGLAQVFSNDEKLAEIKRQNMFIQLR